MSNGRTIFIGDIHGCYKEFKLLLKKINLTKNDKVYLTGDLINRGPKSFKVLKYIFNNQNQFKSVLGNNELNFLNWIKNGDYKHSKKVFLKLKEKFIKYPEILTFLLKLPKFIETDNFLLIHGGLIPGKKPEEHTEDEITRLREYNGKAWYLSYNGVKKVIYGHWGEDGLRIRKNTIGLDTGCVFGKWLTAYILETGEIIQQSSQDIYINLYKNNED